MLTSSSSSRFATSLILLLLACNAHLITAFFPASPSLKHLVHHWLHWGANLHSAHQAPPAHHPRAETPSHASTARHLPSYVVGAPLPADTNTTNPQHPLQYSLTMMHRPEIDLIRSYLRPDHVYLEFGVGGSTVNFPLYVARAYSLEHNCEWANFLSKTLHARNPEAYKNLHIRCVPVKPGDDHWGTLSNYEHANYIQFRKYVDTVDTLPEQTLDRVFIDGRARLACALKVLPLLNDDSLIFIHDFYARTKHYGAVLQYYTEVSRVLAIRNNDPAEGPIDEPQGIVILRRKPNLNYNLSASDIDKIYESIDWRFPFGPPITSIASYLRYYLTLATDPGQWARARNPDDLIHLMHRDLFRMAVVYIIVMAILNRQTFLKHRLTPQRISAAPTNNRPPTRSASQPTLSEVTFVETEGMRAANARRKRASSANKPT